MIPGIWFFITFFCLTWIILDWIFKKPVIVLLYILLGINAGLLGLWYSDNPQTLEHFHYVYHKTQIEKSK